MLQSRPLASDGSREFHRVASELVRAFSARRGFRAYFIAHHLSGANWNAIRPSLRVVSTYLVLASGA